MAIHIHQNSNFPKELGGKYILLVLFLFSLPWLFWALAERKRLRTLRQALGASMLMNVLWFRHRGVPMVLTTGNMTILSDSLGALWKSRKDKEKWFKPIALSIPITTAGYWSITKVGTSLTDKLAEEVYSFLPAPGQEIDFQGKKYGIYAQDRTLGARIQANMAMIAPILENLGSKDYNHAQLTADRSPIFYDGFFHLGWHVSLEMPPRIEGHPDQLLQILDGVLDVLKAIGVTPNA